MYQEEKVKKTQVLYLQPAYSNSMHPSRVAQEHAMIVTTIHTPPHFAAFEPHQMSLQSMKKYTGTAESFERQDVRRRLIVSAHIYILPLTSMIKCTTSSGILKRSNNLLSSSTNAELFFACISNLLFRTSIYANQYLLLVLIHSNIIFHVSTLNTN